MIVGAGDIGMPIIHYLSERGHLLTVIEMNEKRCKEIANHSDAAIFRGSGTDLKIWKSIEAEKLDVILALTNDDEINMKACEIAKKQFGIPFVITRVHQPENLAQMKECADIAICPAQETRRLFLNALESLTVETLCEHAAANFKAVMVTIPPNGSIIGKTVNQLDISENFKIVSVFRNSTFVFPTDSFMFKGGDKVLLVGLSEPVDKTAEKLRNVEIT